MLPGIASSLEDLETEAQTMYGEAGADLLEPPSAVALARALLKGKVARGDAQGTLARFDGECLVITRKAIGKPAAFAIAHELAEWRLRGLVLPNIEKLCNSLAIRLLAPGPAFREAVRLWGLDLVRLGDRFSLTQTAVALRCGEVLRRPVAVVTPLYCWGTSIEQHQLELFAKPPELVLTMPLPRGWSRLTITDERRRVAVVGE